MEDSPGFFGKLPAAGDFVQRRLPMAFVERWDAWLQEMLVCSRQLLGTDWLERYSSTPVWRFFMTSGVIGPESWAGALCPSVDRVGRYFPLSVAMHLPVEGGGSAALLLESGGWFENIEQILLDARQPALDLSSWEEALAAIKRPAALLVAADDLTIPLACVNTAPLALLLSASEGHVARCGRLSAALAGFSRPYSVFVAIFGEDIVALVTEGLPNATQASAMLSRDWAACGWQGQGTASVVTDALVVANADDATRPGDETRPFNAPDGEWH